MSASFTLSAWLLEQSIIVSHPLAVPCTPTNQLQLSWLHLWALLLGTSDFKSVEELSSGRRHRRPSAADMTDVAARLASISSKAEVRWG